MKRELFVVVPSRDRHGMIAELLDALNLPADHVILIDNNSEPPLREAFADRACVIESPDRNIQKLWNLGWFFARQCATGPYVVAFINSDVFALRSAIDQLVEVLEETGAAISFPDFHNLLGPGRNDLVTRPGPVNLFFRMTGYCFVVRGELDVRFDEDLVWWFGDDDFEWRAREHGGTVRVGGCFIDHRDPNGAMRDFPELNEQACRDREHFVKKWGRAPW